MRTILAVMILGAAAPAVALSQRTRTPFTGTKLLTALPARSFHYRILVTGMTVRHDTRDTPMNHDGWRDEVFVATQALSIDRATGALVANQVRKSLIHGDIYNLPGRVRAGSAHRTGGIYAGDIVAGGADPSQPSRPAMTVAFPFIAFDGTLTEGKDDLLLFPSIWEVDGDATPYNTAWLTRVPNMRPQSPDPTPSGVANPPGVWLANDEIIVSAKEGWDWEDEIRQDRPIGMTLKSVNGASFGNVNNWSFRPRVIKFSFEDLETRLATPFVGINGAAGIQMWVEFMERDLGNIPGQSVSLNEYLGGDYILHLWIEKVP